MPAEYPDSFAGGRYRTLRLLGRGGSKTVYAAHDTRLDRDVAVAVVAIDGLDPSARGRVTREARAMGRLGSHPNIVTVFDVLEEDEQALLVSELMTGGDLAARLEAAPGGRLPVGEAVEVAIAVCRALAAAHDQGIVHRDLKPANIWLTAAPAAAGRNGTAKLGDFGLATLADAGSLTRTGAIAGTPAYLSPEQATGEPVTPRSDLYALGVTLYEMVAGVRPFTGGDFVSIIYQHVSSAPVPAARHNPAIPPELDALILLLLAKRPENRPASAAEVAALLEEIARDGAAHAAPPTAPAASPPNRLDRLAPGAFVGRAEELALLRGALDAARAGTGRCVLIGGEPGAGKTRLAEEIAAEAGLRGMRVVWGRCYEEGGTPYWPWVQVVRALTAARDSAALRTLLGSGAPEVAALVTAVRERLPDLPPPPALDPETARTRLFDSLLDTLRAAAAERPLLVVLDDVQWADASSLLLLRRAVRELAAPLALVCTHREPDARDGGAFARALADLARVPSATRLSLSGLSAGDVERLIELNAGTPPAPALVESLRDRTSGNAFFLVEIVRLLAADGALDTVGAATGDGAAVPESVRAVLHGRLAHLSAACNQALRAAAAGGAEIDLACLARVLDAPEDGLLDLLDEAVAARVLAESRTAAGRFSFTHAILREMLYDELGPTRRARLHQRYGEAIEALSGTQPRARLAELAFHFSRAGTPAALEKAERYARAAGDRALAQLAYEEAARLYAGALAAREGRPVDEEAAETALRLTLALGDALNRADDLDAARDAFRRAAALARERGDIDALAEAALGFAGAEPAPGVDNRETVALLEEALAALPSRPSRARARLAARLALDLTFAENQERVAALADAAVAGARDLADPGTLAYALHARRMVVTWQEPPAARIVAAEAIARLAGEAGDRPLALTGHHWRLSDLLEMGEVEALDAEIALCERLTESLRQPVFHWYGALVRGMRTLLDGRLEEAERHIHEALNLGQRAHPQTAMQTYGGQLLVLRREQGRLAELAPVLEALAAGSPDLVAWRAALAFVYARAGREVEARAQFARLTSEGLERLPRDVLWLSLLAVLAETAAALEDRAAAATLYALLTPYDGRTIVMANALACLGASAYYLGILAATLGEARAEEHFRAALAMHERMGARPWVARTRARYAAWLLRAGGPAESVAALGLLDDARRTAGELSAAGLSAEIDLVSRGP